MALLGLGGIGGLIAGIIAPGVDWKKKVADLGAAEARKQLQTHWRIELKPKLPQIAAKMEAEGVTMTGTGNSDMNDEGLGRGFVVCRTALYWVIKDTGKGHIPGALCDAWRDGADNDVWVHMKDRVTPTTSTVDIVNMTAEEFIRHTL